MCSVLLIRLCTTAIPVTSEVGEIEFDPLESYALKLMEGENLMNTLKPVSVKCIKGCVKAVAKNINNIKNIRIIRTGLF